MSNWAHLDTATNGEIQWWSASLGPVVSGPGLCQDAVPEAGAPVAVSRCALPNHARKASEFLLIICLLWSKRSRHSPKIKTIDRFGRQGCEIPLEWIDIP